MIQTNNIHNQPFSRLRSGRVNDEIDLAGAGAPVLIVMLDLEDSEDLYPSLLGGSMNSSADIILESRAAILSYWNPLPDAGATDAPILSKR